MNNKRFPQQTKLAKKTTNNTGKIDQFLKFLKFHIMQI